MNGNITIGRTTSNKDEAVHIRITDESSRITFIDVYLSLEDFTKAITNSEVDCKYELRGLNNIGKKLETKTELVPLDNPYQATDEQREMALKPFEVDGWSARKSDIENHHCYKQHTVEVTFSRFVEQ